MPRNGVRVFWIVGLLLLAPGSASAQTVRDILHAGRCNRPFEAHGLSLQIAATQACRFGSIQAFTPSGNVTVSPFGAPGFIPYGTPAMVAGLFRVRRHLSLNAAYRTIIDQYLTIVRHADGTCGGSPARIPGGGHVAGCAVDMDTGLARAAQGDMSSAGFDYWGTRDPVHFSYRGCSGANGVPGPTNYDDVRAFQVLWNSNHPEAQIAVDGNFDNALGPLLASPAGGFPHDGCVVDEDGDGSPQGEDCDDHDARNRPGGTEDCDGRDNDCDARVDEDAMRVCGSDVGTCRTGIQGCASAMWGTCVGEIPPVAESCNGLDDDCDGTVDDDRICEHDDASFAAAVYSPAAHSDFDGDGRMDACMRTPRGFECLVSGVASFERVVIGGLDDEAHWDEPAWFTSVRMGDVDGDGRDDLCARRADAIACASSDATGFAAPRDRIALGTTSPGANAPEIWLADVDGDRLADLCVRDRNGLRCVRSDDGHTLTLGALSDANGWDDVARHGTIRFGDVDGDGRDDVCAREVDGMACWLASGTGFERRIVGPRWRDADGWSELPHWSTIRLADVDGDRRADLCGRSADGFRCWIANGAGFDRVWLGPALSTADGWDARDRYATLRLADVDGNGTADLCARASDGVRCWLAGEGGFDRVIEGPPLTDAAGWNAPERFATIRLADVDGDGRGDLCARGADGLRCWTSDGDAFARVRTGSSWTDVAGLGDPAFEGTLTIGGIDSRDASDALQGGCACRAGATSPMPRALVGIVLALWGIRRRRR